MVCKVHVGSSGCPIMNMRWGKWQPEFRPVSADDGALSDRTNNPSGPRIRKIVAQRSRGFALLQCNFGGSGACDSNG